MPTEALEICDPADVAVASTRARSLAALLGFSRQAQWEIATAVSEAATNVIKHAQHGHIDLRAIDGNTPYFEFEAVDHGGGIDDVEMALRDGVSEGRELTADAQGLPRRGLGVGLGAIRRLMDRFEVRSTAHQTCVLARKDLTRAHNWETG